MDEIIKLKELLLEPMLEELGEKTEKFNPFDVLKIARAEIRHSNVLGWLLDPNESHGFSTRFIDEINKSIAKNRTDEIDELTTLLLMDCSDAVVYREWQNIDVLVVSRGNKYVLCIENKVDSSDHDEQLNKYTKIINDSYAEYKKFFVYLTPEGIAPLEETDEEWICIGYEEILKIIEHILDKVQPEINVRLFIESYIKILRREIVSNADNERVVKLCQEIYEKHKEAIDLIFENRPDKLLNVSELFRIWCEREQDAGEIIFSNEKCNKSSTKFQTKFMSNKIPCGNALSGWGTQEHYYYEIKSWMDKKGDIKYSMQLTFSNLNSDDNEKKQFEEIDNILNNKELKKDWQWRTVIRTKTKTIKETQDLPDEDEENNEIFKELNNLLIEVRKWENTIEKTVK